MELVPWWWRNYIKLRHEWNFNAFEFIINQTLLVWNKVDRLASHLYIELHKNSSLFFHGEMLSWLVITTNNSLWVVKNSRFTIE